MVNVDCNKNNRKSVLVRFLVSILTVVTLAVSFLLPTGSLSAEAAAFSGPLPKDTMPLGIWVAPPPLIQGKSAQSFITNERYKEIKDAGINLVIGLYEKGNSPDVQDALNAAEKNGLKYIVSDDRLFTASDPTNTSYIKMYINRYAKHPAYAGNLIVDEPGMASFDFLGKLKKTYEQIAPGKYFYLNMLPTYATSGQLYYGASTKQSHTTKYEDYIKQYFSKVKPGFLSYDYYPMLGSFPNVLEGYFRNLAVIRSQTMKNGIPFWVFIQTCSFGGGTRTPTKEEIFWQVNTALAYGAKGIQYFTYWTPLEASAFGEGMVSRDGKKTVRYGYVQEMNRHIAAIDQILLNTTSKGLLVHGKMPAPIDGGETLKSFAPIQAIRGNDALIGCFEDKAGKKQLYVVNTNLKDKAQVMISLKDAPACKVWQKAASKNVGKQSELVLALDAGEGVLVEIQ